MGPNFAKRTYSYHVKKLSPRRYVAEVWESTLEGGGHSVWGPYEYQLRNLAVDAAKAVRDEHESAEANIRRHTVASLRGVSDEEFERHALKFQGMHGKTHTPEGRANIGAAVSAAWAAGRYTKAKVGRPTKVEVLLRVKALAEAEGVTMKTYLSRMAALKRRKELVRRLAREAAAERERESAAFPKKKPSVSRGL